MDLMTCSKCGGTTKLVAIDQNNNHYYQCFNVLSQLGKESGRGEMHICDSVYDEHMQPFTGKVMLSGNRTISLPQTQ